MNTDAGSMNSYYRAVPVITTQKYYSIILCQIQSKQDCSWTVLGRQQQFSSAMLHEEYITQRNSKFHHEVHDLTLVHQNTHKDRVLTKHRIPSQGLGRLY